MWSGHKPAWTTAVEREQVGDDAAAAEGVVTLQAEGWQAQGHIQFESDHVHLHLIDYEGGQIVQQSISHVDMETAGETGRRVRTQCLRLCYPRLLYTSMLRVSTMNQQNIHVGIAKKKHWRADVFHNICSQRFATGKPLHRLDSVTCSQTSVAVMILRHKT